MSTTAIPVDTHAYARFTRRLRAVMIDSIVFMLILAGTLIAATSLGSDNIARILGFVVVATWLLYEPVLVSMTGGTIGHWRSNLRVVDDAGGNISFGKAVIRVIIKTLLGWISFISMAATSRHQALHDIMTRSTVQIRDAANAEPHHFAQARAPLPEDVPPGIRRIVVTVGYLIVWAIFGGVILVNALSGSCLKSGACSAAEHLFEVVFELSWLAACAALVGLGWRGRLWGARARNQRAG